MNAERIETIGDARVADYRGIRDGELLRRRGLFVVEGRENVRRLMRESAYHPSSLFLSEPAASAMTEELSKWISEPSAAPQAEPTSGPRIFVASRAVLSEIAGFDIHRGCLALCKRPEPAVPEAVLVAGDAPSVVVVLEDLANPDNVGAVYRNALAFRADAVLLSPRCCDSLYRKAIRVSMGASLVVPTARFSKWPGGLEAVRAAGYTIVALHTGTGALPLAAEAPFPSRVALLFGTEGQGISPAALAASDRRVRIDMTKGFDSVNVATASGIALHEAFRARARGLSEGGAERRTERAVERAAE